VQITYDNALENLSEAARLGITRLGIVGIPIDPRSPWQNGHAESKINLIQRQALAGIPGVVLGGLNRHGQPRFVPTMDGLWPIARLGRHFDAFRCEWNVERTQPVLQNRTPVAVWQSDPTPLRAIQEAQLIANMMREGKQHVVNQKGVFHRKQYYLPLPQSGDRRDWAGLHVHVRYLNRNTEFIAVSLDADFNDFRFAIAQDSLTADQRNRLLAARAAAEAEYERIEADAMAARLRSQTAATEAATDADTGGDSDAAADADGIPTGLLPEEMTRNHGTTIIDTASTSPRRSGRPLVQQEPEGRTARAARAKKAAENISRLGLPLPPGGGPLGTEREESEQ
jgi:putative transposase